MYHSGEMARQAAHGPMELYRVASSSDESVDWVGTSDEDSMFEYNAYDTLDGLLEPQLRSSDD